MNQNATSRQWNAINSVLWDVETTNIRYAKCSRQCTHTQFNLWKCRATEILMTVPSTFCLHGFCELCGWCCRCYHCALSRLVEFLLQARVLIIPKENACPATISTTWMRTTSVKVRSLFHQQLDLAQVNNITSQLKARINKSPFHRKGLKNVRNNLIESQERYVVSVIRTKHLVVQCGYVSP